MTPRPPSPFLSLHICLALLPSAVAHAQANLKSTPPTPAHTAAEDALQRTPSLTLGQYTPALLPVDQGVADRDPLAYSLRFLQPDTRLARDFEELYLVPGRPDLYMRCDGAITAVFSRSEYTKNKKGVITLIPGGTTFHIGPFTLPPESVEQSDLPPNSVAAQPARPASQSTGAIGRASGLVSNAVTLQSAEGPAPDPALAAPPNSDRSTTRIPLTIWNSDRYRRARLASIITAAAPGAAPSAAPADAAAPADPPTPSPAAPPSPQ